MLSTQEQRVRGRTLNGMRVVTETASGCSSENAPTEKAKQADVNLYIMILQPRQEGDHTRLTPFVMMNTDIVGLCYDMSNAESLENAVHKVPVVLSVSGTHNLMAFPFSGFRLSSTTFLAHQLCSLAIEQTTLFPPHRMLYSNNLLRDCARYPSNNFKMPLAKHTR